MELVAICQLCPVTYYFHLIAFCVQWVKALCSAVFSVTETLQCVIIVANSIQIILHWAYWTVTMPWCLALTNMPLVRHVSLLIHGCVDYTVTLSGYWAHFVSSPNNLGWCRRRMEIWCYVWCRQTDFIVINFHFRMKYTPRVSSCTKWYCSFFN